MSSRSHESLRRHVTANMSDPTQALAVHYANATPVPWPDSVCQSECYLYDATNPNARDFIFDMLKTGCVR